MDVSHNFATGICERLYRIVSVYDLIKQLKIDVSSTKTKQQQKINKENF